MAKRDPLRTDSEDRLRLGVQERALEGLSRVLGHRFAAPRLLAEALTHPSATGKGESDYERLEFFGDRVLGLVVADLLFEIFPGEAEGALSQRFAALVRREALARVARTIGLGDHLILAKGERERGGAGNPANLANAMEAVIGALFRDGGLEPAHAFIRRHWLPLVGEADGPPQDSKSALQEWTQNALGTLPVYRTLAVEGPAHGPSFSVEVRVEGFEPALGTGASKRAAEQAAAQILLERLSERDG